MCSDGSCRTDWGGCETPPKCSSVCSANGGVADGGDQIGACPVDAGPPGTHSPTDGGQQGFTSGDGGLQGPNAFPVTGW